MLTARGADGGRIVGLELGADDYVVKAFSAGELVACIRAILRRRPAWERRQTPLEVTSAPRLKASRSEVIATVAGGPAAGRAIRPCEALLRRSR